MNFKKQDSGFMLLCFLSELLFILQSWSSGKINGMLYGPRLLDCRPHPVCSLLQNGHAAGEEQSTSEASSSLQSLHSVGVAAWDQSLLGFLDSVVLDSHRSKLPIVSWSYQGWGVHCLWEPWDLMICGSSVVVMLVLRRTCRYRLTLV